ncbi:uncharacterized protein LOC141622415 [Silene latifolia]|uniref:uncharacterized protein LOC141622415 n=1 Tax=Silene latifolia TaxID=37657 RepID=UPI003D77A789
MMRIGSIVSRNLRRQQIGGVLTKLPTTKYDDALLNFLHLRAHPFPSFFCSSNFISQVEQTTVNKYPLDQLDKLSLSDDECSSSEDECSSSDDECSSSDEEDKWFTKDWSLDEKIFQSWYFSEVKRNIVAPFIQVFSVSLHTDIDDDKPCEVYGSIYATNSRGVVSNLYTKFVANPETVPNKGILSLKGGYDIVLSYGPSTNTTIDFNVSDKSRNTVVIKEKHNLHSFNEDFEDTSNKLIKDIVYGERCFALVCYAKFLYGCRVVVYVAIYTKRDTTSTCVDVHGSIVVGYDNARRFCNNDDEVRDMKYLLFNKPFDQPERVIVGRTMKLSRSVVVLPAGSALVIDADVSDSRGRLVSGSVEFHVGGQSKKSIDDEFGTIKVIVVLDRPHSEFIPDFDSREDVGEAELDALTDNSRVGVSNKIDDQKNIQARSHPEQNLTLTHFEGTRSSDNTVEASKLFYGLTLAELFSVYVCGTNHKVSSVCGKISVEDSNLDRVKNIFGRDLDNPDILSEEKGSILIEGQYPMRCHDPFRMYLYLIDPTNNKELCWGEFDYNHITSRGDLPLNKRLCTYIKGAHGYALLHYVIFDSACQATVEIRFLPDHPSSLPIFICGSVFATYSNQSYSTMYAKKYYRSRLFYKPKTDRIQLVDDLRIPLLKSVVVVPEGAALVVELDLDILSCSNVKDIVFGKKEMKIGLSRTIRAEILGNYSGVQISAKFERC